MIVEPFDKEKHLKLMAEWYEGWGYRLADEKFIPRIGFVVDNMVMCCLGTSDCGVAFIECLISDPDSPPERRRAAQDVALKCVADKARALGYQRIVGFLTRQWHVDTATRVLGMKPTPGWMLEGDL
jgi:hypothetical protein